MTKGLMPLRLNAPGPTKRRDASSVLRAYAESVMLMSSWAAKRPSSSAQGPARQRRSHLLAGDHQPSALQM